MDSEKDRSPVNPVEIRFVAALVEAARVLETKREVSEDVWAEMQKRQELSRESLTSNVLMSGPVN
jgi:hypothetical protein